jgi:site-specific DNA recombinase
MKRGKDACPTPSLPAQEIEDFVVNEIRKVARDPELQRQVFEETVRQQKKLIPKLEKEHKRLQRELQWKREEIRRLVAAIGGRAESSPSLTERIGSIEVAAAGTMARLLEIDNALRAIESKISTTEISNALSEFGCLWDVLTRTEQVQLITAIAASISCGASGEMSIQFTHAVQ